MRCSADVLAELSGGKAGGAAEGEGEARRRGEAHRIGDRLDALAANQKAFRRLDAALRDIVADRAAATGPKATRQLTDRQIAQSSKLGQRGGLDYLHPPLVDQPQAPA